MQQAKEQVEGVIFDIKKYAIHDGPGIRTTVFLKGCPLRCKWCHNPESWALQPEPMFRPVRCVRCGQCVETCPQDAIEFHADLPKTNPTVCTRCGTCLGNCPGQAREIVGRRVTVEEIMAEIVKDRVFYDESGGGVTFSGGEPLMQHEFLTALLQQCNCQGIHTAIDTCCQTSLSVLKKIIPYANLFLCDIKHLDSDKHRLFTGVGNADILSYIAFLAQSNCPIIIRIPVVPGFNYTHAEIEAIVDHVKSLKNVKQIDLLPYNSGGVSKAKRLSTQQDVVLCDRPGDEMMEAFSEIIKKHGFKTNIGG